jgi:hypothetical protein
MRPGTCVLPTRFGPLSHEAGAGGRSGVLAPHRVRTLRDIHSGTVTILQRPGARVAQLAAIPFALLGCYIAAHGSTGNPRPWLSAGLLGLTSLALAIGGRGRRRRLVLRRGGTLVWQAGPCADDPYRVVSLLDGGQRVLVLEHADPAIVLSGARRLAQDLGARLVGHEGFAAPEAAASPPRQGFGVVSPIWLRQGRVAQAMLAASLLIACVFVMALLPRPNASWISRALPCASLLVVGVAGVWLLSLRVHVTLTNRGLAVAKRGFNWTFARSETPLTHVLAVRALGHAGHPARHLIIETPMGPRSILMSDRSAQRVASVFLESQGSPKPAPAPRAAEARTPLDSERSASATAT